MRTSGQWGLTWRWRDRSIIISWKFVRVFQIWRQRTSFGVGETVFTVHIDFLPPPRRMNSRDHDEERERHVTTARPIRAINMQKFTCGHIPLVSELPHGVQTTLHFARRTEVMAVRTDLCSCRALSSSEVALWRCFDSRVQKPIIDHVHEVLCLGLIPMMD